jgi:exodeoxyribonuclease VII large subunit
MPPRKHAQPGPPADAPVYSVRQLNREAKRLLEGSFPAIWVSGEISRFTHHGSGHMYFDLKDADASISCAMFRGSQRGLHFKPRSGLQVTLQGKVSIFEAGGRYQMIVERMEEAGEGLLRRQFEELKMRLQAEGLFSEDHKVPLPGLPATIGVVTSPTGAAVRDILHILRRRYPLATVIVYPTRVQGDGAKEEIAAALQIANQRAECDVLIVARGGGSLEDLWAFNEEVVARAIYASELPVISGVGHEIDFTIADLVADLRAPTPSGAAEIIVPDRETLLKNLHGTERRATLSLRRVMEARVLNMRQLESRLQRSHPGTVLHELQQRCDELTRALGRTLKRLVAEQHQHANALHQRLALATPAGRIATLTEYRQRTEHRLIRAMQQRTAMTRQHFSAVTGNLNAVSPLATLERGYAIVRHAGRDSVVRNATELKTGDAIETQLAKGSVTATVTNIDNKD